MNAELAALPVFIVHLIGLASQQILSETTAKPIDYAGHIPAGKPDVPRTRGTSITFISSQWLGKVLV
jgi:hypothetical protein